MKTIQILDKTFVSFISHKEIQSAIKELSKKILNDYGDKTPLFICILNGAFVFAADLFKEYTGKAEITFIRLSSYEGTSTTGKVKPVLGLDTSVIGRDLIILEDIIDSGITIEFLISELAKENPSSIRVATLLLKPDALQKPVKPDYVGIELPNDFIVGYGLDYDGLGRNLKDIYKMV